MTKTHISALISLILSYSLLLLVPVLDFPLNLLITACATGFISMIFQVYLAHQADEPLCTAIILMVGSLFWIFPWLLLSIIGWAMFLIYLLISMSVQRNAFLQYRHQKQQV